MIALVYVSAARKLFDEAELSALLTQCRANNARLGVTGVLLYADGNFMQALEGEEAVLDDLTTKIGRDPRHKAMKMLLRWPIAQRQFDRWSMALRRLADLPAEDQAHCSALMTAQLGPQGADQTVMQTLLESFRRSMG